MSDDEWFDIVGDTYRYALVVNPATVNEEHYDKVKYIDNLERIQGMKINGKRANVLVYVKDKVHPKWFFEHVAPSLNPRKHEIIEQYIWSDDE